MTTPEINLPIHRVGCDRHLEPFRERWPKGYPLFLVALFDAWIKAKTTANEAKGEIENVEELLEKIPLCCRVDPRKLLGAYRESKVGRVRVCQVCGLKRSGTPYRRRPPEGGVDRKKHVCFECIIYRMRPNP